MKKHIFYLLSMCAVVFAGSSPNAKFIREKYKNDNGTNRDVIEDATLDVPGLLRKHGYPAETHRVVTADNYILKMHRIPHGRDKNSRPGPRPVVFLMHGLLSSSADWIVLGPLKSLGHYLAEEGYDVWLGNARGNFYSRKHRYLNPDDRISLAFWKFSWDEIGFYDLPAFIDHILSITKQRKLHYIGHSQGGTTFLVLNSLKPEYNKKFISFHGLAPVSFFTNNNNNLITTVSPYEKLLEYSAYKIGIGEVFQNRDFIEKIADNYCVNDTKFILCDSILVKATSNYYRKKSIPVFLGHAPAGSSVRQFAHYGQSIKYDTFKRYRYNGIANLAAYGTWLPPDYDLTKITVPTYIYYSYADNLANYKDVKILVKKLPNIIVARMVENRAFDHLDFVWGDGVKGLVYSKILYSMRDAENKFV